MNEPRSLSSRSVAILGVSRSSYKWGRVAAKQLIEGGFPGEIYLINPTIPEVLGRTTYASLLDVPSIACIPTTAIWSLRSVQYGAAILCTSPK